MFWYAYLLAVTTVSVTQLWIYQTVSDLFILQWTLYVSLDFPGIMAIGITWVCCCCRNWYNVKIDNEYVCFDCYLLVCDKDNFYLFQCITRCHELLESFSDHRRLKGYWTVLQVAEVRSFGKNVVIGEKNCDTVDLFAAQRQSLNISLNATGSIKLGLVVKWMYVRAT